MKTEREEVLQLFKSFLKKHNAIEDFVKCNIAYGTHKVVNYDKFISASFEWNGNIQKWRDLDDLWVEELKQKGIKC